jgi:PEGA domain
MMSSKKRVVGIGVLVAASLSAHVQAASLPFNPGTGRIHLDPHVTSAKSLLLRNGEPVILLVDPVKDGRPDAPSPKVGDVHTTVMFMSGDSLTLDQDISTVVSKALNDQLAADGFRVVSDPREPHDFVVDALMKEFRFDIVDQDVLNIDIDVTLRESKSSEVLWAGSLEEKSSRFAGVSGDTRNSIIRHFSRGLSDWAVKASANVSENLLKTYPESMALVERKDLAWPNRSGVKTLQAATPREATPPSAPGAAPPVVAPPVVAPPVAASPAQPATAPLAASQHPQTTGASGPNGKGFFSVTTVPSKAKVYVDDVYYGTSPLRLEFDPGVKLFHFELAGYKKVAEKVSIRGGETTELEVDFQK